VITGFTHEFFGISTALGAISTFFASGIGTLYAVAELLILTMQKWAAALALACLVSLGAYEMRVAESVMAELFACYTYSRYEPAALHYRIAAQLERVANNEIDRLMLLVPPRHGKSELASRRFPAWILGRHPELQFISASASATLSEDFGRDVRNTINGSEYAEIFDTRLAEDSQARGRWRTQAGGSYYAVGVGGSLYGIGADILLIDDPFGSASDARSERIRKDVHLWYSGTCYNRLEKNGRIIIIAHRVHQDDLSGRLLAQQAAGGDKWEVVELKALSDGKALWPEKFDADALARIKQNITAQDWAALYMQEPTQETGSYFKEEWLRPYIDEPPLNNLNIYGASDFAVTSDGGDYTCHVVLGVDHRNRHFLLDLWREQASSRIWLEIYCDLVRKWRPNFWAMEKGQITGALGPFLEKRSIERKAWTCRELFPTKHDKCTRAQSIRGRMELSGLFVPAAAKWLPDLKAELLAFPTGRHDDQVDALGLLGLLMDKWAPGHLPVRPKSEFKDRAYVAKELDEMRVPSFMTL
jgi:predicted phage terminase large subunit-like protein